jgi:hypothetical protein
MIYDVLSNDNEIVWKLNDHQFKNKKHIYKFFSIFKIFFVFFIDPLSQNNPLLTDPFSSFKVLWIKNWV